MSSKIGLSFRIHKKYDTNKLEIHDDSRIIVRTHKQEKHKRERDKKYRDRKEESGEVLGGHLLEFRSLTFKFVTQKVDPKDNTMNRIA